MATIQKNIRLIGIHILVWVSLYSIVLFQFSYFRFKTIPSNLYLNLAESIVLFYFNYYFLVPSLLLRKRILWYVAVSLGIIVVSVYGNQLYFSHSAAEAFHGTSFISVPGDQALKISIPREEFPTDQVVARTLPAVPFLWMPSIILAFHFVAGAMLKVYVEWNRNEVVREKIENEKITSELQFLKAQLNPHFLFNSLNAIYSLSVKKSDTSEAIITLSELMRYMLYEANKELVPLSKELDYIKNYIALQRLRLSNSENVTINIYGNERHLMIQPLLFISFIENAFKYGTDFKGKTYVKINISIKEDVIHFYVSNIIGAYKKELENSGVGLVNIKNRLDLLYPDSHELLIENNGQTYSIYLTLNKIKREMYNY